MSVLNTISGVSNNINIRGASLSLVSLGANLVKTKNQKPGIDGFLFDVPMSDIVTHTAQITDHWIEDNATIQDHVAFEPVKIALTGRVAELVYKKSAALSFLSAALDRLQLVGAFKPDKGLMARKYIAAIDQLGSAIDSAKKVYNDLSSIFSDDPAKNAQQKAFATFEKMFLGRSIMTVETPWKTYDNMIIENWTAEQSEESIYETTFTLNFKQVRLLKIDSKVGKIIGRRKAQAVQKEQKGELRGKTAAASLFDSATNAATGAK